MQPNEDVLESSQQSLARSISWRYKSHTLNLRSHNEKYLSCRLQRAALKVYNDNILNKLTATLTS